MKGDDCAISHNYVCVKHVWTLQLHSQYASTIRGCCASDWMSYLIGHTTCLPRSHGRCSKKRARNGRNSVIESVAVRGGVLVLFLG